MPSAMVTFNGRITLPTDIRKQLGLKTGDNIDFVEIEKGRFAICPRAASIHDVNDRVPGLSALSGAEEFNPTVN